MVFLKIENNVLVDAPEVIERNGKVVYGYNKESNEWMLKQDGYQKFSKTIIDYEIKDGKIVKKERKPDLGRSTFTKLQIRRAMRQLGIENKLDNILDNNPQFKKDWNDAIEIDLNDQMIKDAIQAELIYQKDIDQIKNTL